MRTPDCADRSKSTANVATAASRSIAWSTLLFAVAHMDPHSAVFALPLGVWLGAIAWRLGVIWPGIACQAALNALWSIYFIGAVKTAPSTALYVASAVVVGAVSVVGFVASLRILSRATRH